MKTGEFFALLKETTKILSQNVKLLSLVAILQLILYFFLFLFNAVSTSTVIYDLIVRIMDISSASFGTPEFADLLVRIKEDAGVFLGVELVFFVIYFFISLFSRTAIVFISASSYAGDSLSVKELVSRVAKAWTRQFVTGFYVMLLSLGYTTSFFLPFLIPSLALLDHHPIAFILIIVVLVLVMIVFSLYLSVAWMLGLVVSVLEESRGLEALGKARGLIKGMRLQGFALNVFITVLTMILTQLPQIITRFVQLPGVAIAFFGLIQMVFICLVLVFEFVAYTVLYVRCKKNHGEEVKMRGSLEYRQVPTIEEEIV